MRVPAASVNSSRNFAESRGRANPTPDIAPDKLNSSAVGVSSINYVNKKNLGELSTERGNIQLKQCVVKGMTNRASPAPVLRSEAGAINLDDTQVHGDIYAKRGDISIKKGDVLGCVKTERGGIELDGANVKDVHASGRSLKMYNSTVSGNVRVDASEDFLNVNSVILGKLSVTGERLALGNGTVQNVFFGGRRPPQEPEGFSSDNNISVRTNGGMFIGSLVVTDGTVVIDGVTVPSSSTFTVPSGPGGATTVVINGAVTGPPVPVSMLPQTVTLADGGILHKLAFQSPECTLVLEGSASYQGDHNAPELTVVRDLSSKLASGDFSRLVVPAEVNTPSRLNISKSGHESIEYTNGNRLGKLQTEFGNITLAGCVVKRLESNASKGPILESGGGDIRLMGTVVQGDIKATSGHVSIHSNSDIDGCVRARRGVELKSAKVREIDSSGKIEIYGSEISGNVHARGKSEALTKINSDIHGTLFVTGEALALGSGTVRRVVFDGRLRPKEREVFERGFSIPGIPSIPSIPSISAVRSQSINNASPFADWYLGLTEIDDSSSISFVTRVADRKQAPRGMLPQTVVLGEGAILGELEFRGPRCTLRLEGSARYTGDHRAPGLTVERYQPDLRPVLK